MKNNLLFGLVLAAALLALLAVAASGWSTSRSKSDMPVIQLERVDVTAKRLPATPKQVAEGEKANRSMN
jgi:hypothetical protein